MARRPTKKTPTKSKKSALGNVPVSPEVHPPQKAGGIPFGLFFVGVLIILGILYGPGLFKGGVGNIGSVPSFSSKPKNFLLKKVAQINLNPTPGRTFFATDITAVGTDEFAVTNSPGNQVLIYDFKGKLIRKWGKGGAGPSDLKEPSGITSDRKGNLYVLDTWNGAIKVFNFYGKLEKVLDLTHFGFFYGPRRIGWGGDCLLVPNPANFHLGRLSLTGDLLGVWDGKDVIGQVSCAVGDGKGHYYLADGTPDKVQIRVLDESGKVIKTMPGVGAFGMAFDSKGRLFVGCYGEGSRVYDPDGKLLGVLADEAEPEKPLNLFYGIDVNSKNMILSCAAETATVYTVAVDGEK